MKLNIMFLIIGLIFTFSSKLLQITNKIKLGNALVFPAAIFFVLAIIFSLPKIKQALENASQFQHIIALSIWACIGVVSFQAMMIILVGSGNKLALLLILPILLSIYLVIQKWRLL